MKRRKNYLRNPLWCYQHQGGKAPDNTVAPDKLDSIIRSAGIEPIQPAQLATSDILPEATQEADETDQQ